MNPPTSDIFNNNNNNSNCCQQINSNNTTVPEIIPKKSSSSLPLGDETSDNQSVIHAATNAAAATTDRLHILNERYLLTESECRNIKNTSQFKCFDTRTKQEFLSRIFHEKYDKIVLAYFKLKNDFKSESDADDDDDAHHLVRPAYDIIPISFDRSSYIIIKPPGTYDNLHSYIRHRKYLKETEAKQLFGQICKMVELCHRNGIILRDLKLRKFYFIDHDRSKLQYECLDGSVILDDSDDDSLSEKIGCPLYVAPEVISTTTTFGGKAADVWALGVILYAMLAGAYPFNDSAGQAQPLFSKIIACQYCIPPTLSSEAQCLIKCLLRRTPAERPLSEEILFHPWFNVEQSFVMGDPGDHLVPNVIRFEEEKDGYELT